jgi:hypothetical protein
MSTVRLLRDVVMGLSMTPNAIKPLEAVKVDHGEARQVLEKGI